MRLVAGTSNLPLARGIGDYLGLPLTRTRIRRFADKEVFVEILENVRGEDVFVVQSAGHPTNDNLMELLIAIDALRRGSARRVTAVMPYYGYSRQDRKTGPRTPISAKLIANLLCAAGANRVLTLDLHADQIQGFFDIPLDNIFSLPVFLRDIRHRYAKNGKPVIVSPDVGGVKRARAYATRLDTDLAIADKRRERANACEVFNIIGEVRGRDCIFVDDLVDTAGTLCRAADRLMEEGAKSVSAYVTHGVLSGEAVSRIAESPMDRLVITDSIAASDDIRGSNRIEQVSIAPLLGEAIRRVSEESSVSSLFH